MKILIPLIMLVWAGPALAEQVQEVTGAVVPLDGDTIAFVDPFSDDVVTVRLFGVDAPEMDTSAGPHARAALDDLVAFEHVTCVGHETDRYERLVAICEVNGQDLAEVLLRSGWVFTYRTFLLGHDNQDGYLAAEADARSRGAGLWGSLVQPF